MHWGRGATAPLRDRAARSPPWPHAVPTPGRTEAGEGTELERLAEPVALFCGYGGWGRRTEPCTPFTATHPRPSAPAWDGNGMGTRFPVAEGMGKTSAGQASLDQGAGSGSGPKATARVTDRHLGGRAGPPPPELPPATGPPLLPTDREKRQNSGFVEKRPGPRPSQGPSPQG